MLTPRLLVSTCAPIFKVTGCPPVPARLSTLSKRSPFHINLAGGYVWGSPSREVGSDSLCINRNCAFPAPGLSEGLPSPGPNCRLIQGAVRIARPAPADACGQAEGSAPRAVPGIRRLGHRAREKRLSAGPRPPAAPHGQRFRTAVTQQVGRSWGGSGGPRAPPPLPRRLHRGSAASPRTWRGRARHRPPALGSVAHRDDVTARGRSGDLRGGVAVPARRAAPERAGTGGFAGGSARRASASWPRTAQRLTPAGGRPARRPLRSTSGTPRDNAQDSGARVKHGWWTAVATHESYFPHQTQHVTYRLLLVHHHKDLDGTHT